MDITLTGAPVNNQVKSVIEATIRAHLPPGQYEARVLPPRSLQGDESVAFKATGSWEAKNVNAVSAEVTINWRSL